MERLFVAAWPDAATTDAIRAIPQPNEHGVRWVPEERWHVTLRFLGACDRHEVESRLAAAALPAAHAHLGPAVDRLGSQLVVPVVGVDDLAATVLAATADLGEPPRRRFRGHLTIARTRRGATSSVLGHPVTVSFAIAAVALIRSDLTPDGPRYTTLTTYPTT